MAKYVGKRIVPLPCGEWVQTKEYEMLSVVLHKASGDSYTAKRQVPAGTAITDTAFWAKSSEWSQQVKNMSDQLIETLRQVRADNDATKAAIRSDNNATESAIRADNKKIKDELTEKVDTATAAMNVAKADLDEADRRLSARMNSIVEATPSDAEVLDARVDYRGITYRNLGQHVRQSEENQIALDRFTRKSITYAFDNAVNVVAGDYSNAAKILDANIPSGTVYNLRISSTAEHGNIAVYEQYANGYKLLSGNLAQDSERIFTAEGNIIEFRLYVIGGFMSSGTVTVHCDYTELTSGSLEERIDTLEANESSYIPINRTEMFELAHFNASGNRLNEEKLIHGKRISYAYGEITDSETHCMYYLDVTPGDAVYFWRFHNNSVISGFSDGIGVFDQDSNFIRRGGIGGYQYSYTVPDNVYKLGLNFLESFYAAGDRMIVIINDAEKPYGYEEYRDENDAYLSTVNTLQNVDFNSLLPLGLKSSGESFISSIAHMGCSEYYPGNTELSIIGAKKAGFDGVEMDVQITSDGVFVLYHDIDMVRVGGDSTQTIEGMSYADLQQFDYGEWKNPRFKGTPLCTFERAVMLCRLLNMKVYVDCKGIKSIEQFTAAGAIVDKWGMHDNTFWLAGSFVNVWTAIPDAKIIFPAGSKLTGSDWSGTDGWFTNLPANYPEKATECEGIWKFNDDVFFGVVNDYSKMNEDGYGLAGLQAEAIAAQKYNIKYGLYAVDDTNIIYSLSTQIPYMQYMESNKVPIQNAINEYLGITKADYILQ